VVPGGGHKTALQKQDHYAAKSETFMIRSLHRVRLRTLYHKDRRQSQQILCGSRTPRLPLPAALFHA